MEGGTLSSAERTDKTMAVGMSADGTIPAPPGSPLRRADLELPPERVAPWLLGKILFYSGATGALAGCIVETEAYLGPHRQPPDPASHSFRGPTPRNRVLFGPAGHAYVYSIYGRYFCMNVSCEADGRAGCVLIRAVAPVMGWERMAANRGFGRQATLPELVARLAPKLTSGPSRLCQAFGISRAEHNGLDLLDPDSPLQLRQTLDRPPQEPLGALPDSRLSGPISVTARIGIKAAVDWPLRFALTGHKCVSGPKRAVTISVNPGA